MSNLSIFEKKWLDLVFEGKNQEYGAYKLRQDSTKTTIIAFFSGILFIGFVSGIGMLFSSFGPKPIIRPEKPLDTIIKVDIYVEPKTDEPKPAEPIINNSAPVEKVPNNQNYVVARKEEAKEPIPITSELPNINTPIGTPGTGTPGTPGVIDGGGTEPKPVVITPKGPVPSAELDKQPFFPGGIKKFYEYVGTNFEKQNIDEEEGQAIRVLVSFVIEKNGSMTDIEVTRKTTPEIDKEAIRVLKSLKTKWAPGIKNGEPVRTQFTLPITVML
ncbi:energy transducer TonB [Flavobacterium chungnamense]|uniref:Energy transducer TonB n=1 Tax=Flavobacterium chungnamense TaxID=706182 RepID=A0ABP7UF53_9FLAO